MIDNNFKSIIDLIQAFPDEQTCIDHLEKLRWDGDVVSPFDSLSKVYNCKGNKYKCKNTGKYFNVKTNTIFDNTKMPLQKWFLAIWLVTSHKKGISSLQLGRDLNITQKSAWFMLQRIRKCFEIENNNDLDGVVEADESFYGGKNKNRHGNKKVKNSQGRSFKDKTPILGLVQRGGKMNAYVVNDTKAKSIQPIIKRVVRYGARLVSDEWWAYNNLGRFYDHHIVNHAKKEYVSHDNPEIHSNTIEGTWKIMKNSLRDMYNHISKKHLQLYVDEFVFRYNTRKITESIRFHVILRNLEYKTTYKELING